MKRRLVAEMSNYYKSILRETCYPQESPFMKIVNLKFCHENYRKLFEKTVLYGLYIELIRF